MHACACEVHWSYLPQVVVDIEASASPQQELDQFAYEGQLLLYHGYVERSAAEAEYRTLHRPAETDSSGESLSLPVCDVERTCIYVNVIIFTLTCVSISFQHDLFCDTSENC